MFSCVSMLFAMDFWHIGSVAERAGLRKSPRQKTADQSSSTSQPHNALNYF